MESSLNIEQAKRNMLRSQIREQFMLDDHILKLLQRAPRDLFVPEAYKAVAFADMHIAIGFDQVMMSPNEEARMLQALKIMPKDHMLEIGTGTGYISFLLANLGKSLQTIDIFPEFIQQAKEKLAQLTQSNIAFSVTDAAEGVETDKKFDVICITAATPLLPESYLQNLQVGGRLFAIIGKAPAMTATLITRRAAKQWDSASLFEILVPEMVNAIKANDFEF